MNSENFHEYVKNPSMLHQVSYQELKSLVLQYPYSPNLRYLLLLKSLFEENKDFDRNQVLASLTSPDRKKLRLLVKQYTRIRDMQENYAINEEFLELKDLSVLENLVEEPNPATVAAPVRKAEAIVPPVASSDLDEEIEEDSDLSFLHNLNFDKEEIAVLGELDEPVAAVVPDIAEQQVADSQSETATENIEQLNEVVEIAATGIGITEAPAPVVETPAPVPAIPLEITNEQDVQPMPRPRSSFNSWLKQFNPPQAGLLNTELKDISLNNRPHHVPPPPVFEEGPEQFAEHSVEEDAEIASETLAVLLEKQKLFPKAISMYKRLQLKYPEKSSLFAAKIEELNKKF
ncbi:MAG: hypothetical protein IPN76_19380 [Saprospiraceae bacterium]|nr:hypothetical protein [Saprospiraceae bacterium]